MSLASAQRPLPLPDENKWVNESGDVMTGDLVMDGHSVVFNNASLRSPAPGLLHFGGIEICLLGGACDSGGDITGVTAGYGLLGGGDSGNVTLRIDPAVVALSNQTCEPGNFARGIDAEGQLECQKDRDSTYEAGDGLTLANSTFKINESLTQRRVTGECPPGSAIRTITTDGGTICEPDNDSTYTGTDFALSNQACAVGDVVAGFDANGTVQCKTDQDTTYGGGDFAVSSQSCPLGEAATGINSVGILVCGPVQSPTAGGAKIEYKIMNQFARIEPGGSPGQAVCTIAGDGSGMTFEAPGPGVIVVDAQVQITSSRHFNNQQWPTWVSVTQSIADHGATSPASTNNYFKSSIGDMESQVTLPVKNIFPTAGGTHEFYVHACKLPDTRLSAGPYLMTATYYPMTP